MRPGPALRTAGLLAALAACACAPQRPPGSAPAGTVNGPAPAAVVPAAAPHGDLASRLQALSERAEKPDLTEAEALSIQAEMDRALDAYLSAPEETRSSPVVQGALERMCDLALQISLDANAAPEVPEAGAEPVPLETLLQETTFLAPGDLTRVYAEVQEALKQSPMDFPVTVNDAVLGYVNLYQTKLREWYDRALTRGTPYMPQMKEIFKAEGIPTSLVYLAIVESACNPKAYSRAKAAGMWQFIPGTARRYGLAVDFWEDERFDPERSAKASARYLKDLYDAFGDWHLALAAYNCGEGRIQRKLAKNSGDDFWDMRDKGDLVRETREYVPAILAAILLATNPHAYGFDPPEEAGLEATVEVVIPSATDLRVLARCAGVSVEVLQALNPSLRRLMTPPREYALRIPATSQESFAAAFAAVPEEERAAVRMHTVQKGETLKGIGKRYGVPSEAIRLANLMPSRKVKVGQTLVVPMGIATSDPTLYVEASPRKKSTRGGAVYRVRRGDTLSSIARKTGVPVSTLRSLNAIGQGEAIHPGQRLVLGTGGTAKATSGKVAKKGRESAAGTRTHHVRKGDTLYIIAKKYGVSVDSLCRANRISKGKTLHPGDTLIIP